MTTNNKLIAEEMGYKKKTPTKDIFQHPADKNRFDRIEYLKYDTDWNWLMEVVEKIENTKIDNTIFDIFIAKDKTHIHYSKNDEWFSNIFIHEGNEKLENTYNACIEFIKWYNNEK